MSTFEMDYKRAIESLQQQLESSQRMCAEKDEALKWFAKPNRDLEGSWECPACSPYYDKATKTHAAMCWLMKALSTTCGQDWVRKSEVERLRKLLADANRGAETNSKINVSLTKQLIELKSSLTQRAIEELEKMPCCCQVFYPKPCHRCSRIEKLKHAP